MIPSVTARVRENRKIAPKGWIVTLEAEAGINPRAGQFAHLRVDPEEPWPFLRRPFSIWNVSENEGRSEIDILYTLRGIGTRRMTEKRSGDSMGFLGPLGNTLEVPPGTERAVMVAGGAGIVPFHLFARQIAAEKGKSVAPVLLFGARTRDELYGLEELERLPMEIRTATEDGTHGMKGRVTDLVREYFGREGVQGARSYACGPWAMLAAVSETADELNVPCVLSLETRMGCALGACRACVVPVRRGEADWRYSRVCCEGPNYESRELIFG